MKRDRLRFPPSGLWQNLYQSTRFRFSLAFLGRGVLRMERDSVIHSTISSAASAWLRQNNMASATSPLLGVNPRSISSSLSRSLQRWKADKSHGSAGSPTAELWYTLMKLWTYGPNPKETVLLFFQAAFLAALLVFLLFITVIIRAVEVWIERRWTPQRAVFKHPKVVCSPFGWRFTLRWVNNTLQTIWRQACWTVIPEHLCSVWAACGTFHRQKSNL